MSCVASSPTSSRSCTCGPPTGTRPTDLPALALEHLLNTTERDRCVQLVTAAAPCRPTRPARCRPCSGGSSALGDAAIEDYPPLAVLAGWIAALTGQTAEAQRWAAIVDAASFDLVPVDGTASFDSARAMLRAVMCAAGPEQMLADASFAVAQEPPWSPWRDTALYLCAEAHLLTGDVDQAACPVRGGVRRSQPRTRNADCARAQRVRARTAGDGSRAVGGGGRARSNVPSPPSMSIGCTTTPPACSPSPWRPGSPCTAATWSEADRQLTRAMRARPSCTFVLPFFAVRRPAAARQGVLGAGATSRPLVTCCVRSTTSCSTGQISAPSSTRSPRSADSSPRARRANPAARRP